MGLRVVFFGTPEFAATVLGGLFDSPHEVAGAVAAPDRPAGRGRKVRPGPVSALAREHDVPLFQPEALRELAVQERLREFGADVFAVASYGLILPESLLDIPRFGAINAHGSVLPKLRGAAPVERAILAGLEETGVSIQRMVRRVDAGALYAVRKTSIDPSENAGSLRARLARIATELLLEVLSDIESGKAEPVPQDESEATLAPNCRRERAINWHEPASLTCRRVRAFAPKMGAFALLPEELGDKRLKILAVEPANAEGAPGEVLAASDGEGLVVVAGEGAVQLITVQPEGGRPMDAAAFMNGHGVRVGMRLRDG